jgi:hypothetical protein
LKGETVVGVDEVDSLLMFNDVEDIDGDSALTKVTMEVLLLLLLLVLEYDVDSEIDDTDKIKRTTEITI